MNMRDELKAFVDNEVSEEQRTRILKELETNPELQAEVIELRQISRVVHEEAWQPEPVGLERTLGALRVNDQKRPWWMGPAFSWAMGAACTVVMAAILFPVFAQGKAAKKGAAMPASAPAASEMQNLRGSVEVGGSAADAEAFSLQDQPARGRDAFKTPLAPDPLERAQRDAKDLRKQQSRYASPQASLADSMSLRFEIKTANLSVEVEDVPKAQQAAEGIAKAVYGRVESSNKNNDEGQLASAELTFRVPVSSFETAVNRIRKLGRVLNDSLNGQDVTTQVADTGARLKVLRAEEDQYVELLKATKKIGEVLSVKERLSQVRQEIESLDAQNKSLKSQAAESTIHLSLTEKPHPDRPRQNDEWPEDAWSRAVSGLNSVGRALGSAAVFLFVFSPIWMPVVLVIWWLARRARR